jgi:hypothetical protein
MTSDSRGSGAAEAVTVTPAVFATTLPSEVLVHSAVIVVVPGFFPMATPLPEGSPVVTVATVGMVEVQTSPCKFVKST